MILERFPEIQKLPRDQQAQLYEELGEIIAGEWEAMPADVKAAFDSEAEAYRRGSSNGRTWQEVRARLLAGAWRK